MHCDYLYPGYPIPDSVIFMDLFEFRNVCLCPELQAAIVSMLGMHTTCDIFSGRSRYFMAFVMLNPHSLIAGGNHGGGGGYCTILAEVFAKLDTFRLAFGRWILPKKLEKEF